MMFDIFKKEEKKEEEHKRILDFRKFVTLIVMDGFGIHPDPEGNAVLGAKTPFLDTAWTYGRSTLIHAAGTHVGMPVEEPGNSEVGHLNLGAGQVVYQTLPRINDAISANELYSNSVIKEIFDTAKKNGTKLHLTGVLSAAGVHGHIKHLYSILELCKASGIDPYIHVMLDGRDTGPKEGLLYVTKLVEKTKELGIGKISSIMGRFYGMDRDNRWERTKEAYDTMVGLAPETFTDPLSIIEKAYASGENDEYFKPRMCVNADGTPVGSVKNGDVVLFWNFREDRARQLTKAFVMKEFNYFFRRNYPTNVYFATMTGYEEGLTAHVVFPPLPVKKSLSEFLSENGKKQVHISETEKFMHVTYFFNGGIEAPHNGEDFFNIPSPKVDNYALIPQMSAEKIRDEAVKRIREINTNGYNFVLMNFANPDMVGHTGDYKAVVKANEIVDKCVQDVATETLTMGGAVVITADHGNCETMINRVTKEIDIAHTNNPVPVILLSEMEEIRPKMGIPISRIGTGQKAKQTGLLADVAPTCLGLLGMEIPANMTGVDLRAVL